MSISNVNANNVAGYLSVCKNSSPISSGPSSFLGGLQRETAKLTARQEATEKINGSSVECVGGRFAENQP